MSDAELAFGARARLDRDAEPTRPRRAQLVREVLRVGGFEMLDLVRLGFAQQ
jgi:hypothetical protein